MVLMQLKAMNIQCAFELELLKCQMVMFTNTVRGGLVTFSYFHKKHFLMINAAFPRRRSKGGKIVDFLMVKDGARLIIITVSRECLSLFWERSYF